MVTQNLRNHSCLIDPICVQVLEARDTEVSITVARNKYRFVAARGAMLFFLLNSLNKIHAFYQFSLNAFVVVFARGIDVAPGGKKKAIAPAPVRFVPCRLLLSCPLLPFLGVYGTRVHVC